jgi:hypothetical protein
MGNLLSNVTECVTDTFFWLFNVSATVVQWFSASVISLATKKFWQHNRQCHWSDFWGRLLDYLNDILFVSCHILTIDSPHHYLSTDIIFRFYYLKSLLKSIGNIFSCFGDGKFVERRHWVCRWHVFLHYSSLSDHHSTDFSHQQRLLRLKKR